MRLKHRKNTVRPEMFPTIEICTRHYPHMSKERLGYTPDAYLRLRVQRNPEHPDYVQVLTMPPGMVLDVTSILRHRDLQKAIGTLRYYERNRHLHENLRWFQKSQT